MNAIARTENTALIAPDKAALMTALRDSLYPGAKDSSIEMVLAYCQAGGYDPMTKPVHIVPIWDKNTKTLRDTVMPGIGLYRIIADRSGKYAGQDDAEFGPTMDGWGIQFPQWCKVTVWKVTAAGRVAYSAKVFWLESYSVAGRESDAPNAMWKKRPFGQLEKCAEAAALRKAFPEIGSQPTADEMAGKEDLVESLGVNPAPALPAHTRRTEALKAQMRAVTPETALVAGHTDYAVMAAAEVINPDTGEIIDPIAALLKALDECPTVEALQAHRPAVAALKGDAKRRAVETWKAVEARLAAAPSPAVAA